MTILSVVRDVAMKVGLERPDAVYTSTGRDMLEMQSLIDEVVTDILECHDWQVLQTIKTYTGDGATEGHTLPSDYERMLNGASIWSSRWTWAFNHITDPDDWLEYQVVPYTFVNGNWMIYGGALHILPVMASTETAKFFYISDKIVLGDDATTTKASFGGDSDTLRISEKLLYLGLVWKWKAKKGLDYAEDLENYEDHKAYLIDKDGGSKPVVSGRKRPIRGGIWAFPQTVGS